MSKAHEFIKAIEPWGILLAVIVFVLSAVQFFIEYGDRVEERRARAWQLVTTFVPGNSGKTSALEYLNREDGLLCFDWLRGKLGFLHDWESHNTGCIFLLKRRATLYGINLSPPSDAAQLASGAGVFLRGIDLRRASLGLANFSRAVLSDADLSEANLTMANLNKALLIKANLQNANLMEASLSEANLRDADLTNANLYGANLRGAKLRNAKLNGADLMGADLTDADLRSADLRGARLFVTTLDGAELSGADLRDIQNLSQRHLDMVKCSHGETKLPIGFTIRRCVP